MVDSKSTVKFAASLTALSISLLASGCGGGGDNAGTCSGSDEVCGRTVNNVAPSTPAPNFVLDLSRVPSVNCQQVGSLGEALAYLAAGATQLDADNDGKPCEAEFPNQ